MSTSLYLVLVLVSGLIGLGSLILGIAMWWNIFSKAGHPGAYSLLLFVPIANIIIMFILAFGNWPLRQELEQLRQENNNLRMTMMSQGSGVQPPQPYFPQQPGPRPW